MVDLDSQNFNDDSCLISFATNSKGVHFISYRVRTGTVSTMTIVEGENSQYSYETMHTSLFILT